MAKRLGALLLALVMVVSILPIQAFAYGGTGETRYTGTDASKIANAGTGGLAGYRVSVQYVDLGGIKDYKTVANPSGTPLEDVIERRLKYRYSNSFPCGDNNALYFFNCKREEDFTTYVMYGTELSTEYNISGDNNMREMVVFEDSDDFDEISNFADTGYTWETTILDAVKEMESLNYDGLCELVDKKGNTLKNMYLAYLHDILTCKSSDITGDHDWYNKKQRYYADARKITAFFQPSGYTQAQVDAINIIHMLLICKYTGTPTDSIREYCELVNKGADITTVPIIVIESLATFFHKDSTDVLHFWTLAQWISKIQGWSTATGKNELYSKLERTTVQENKTSNNYINNFLNPLTESESTPTTIKTGAGSLSWSSFGMVTQANIMYGLKSDHKWYDSTEGYVQTVMLTNTSTILNEMFADSDHAYIGYSIYGAISTPPATENAEFDGTTKNVWYEYNVDSNDHTADNGMVKVTRNSGESVGIEGHYQVKGNLAGDSAMVQWLQTEGADGIYKLTVSLFNTKLSEEKNLDGAKANTTWTTDGSPHAKWTTPNVPKGNESESAATYVNKSYTSQELIDFITGKSAVYFVSSRYTKNTWEESGTYSCEAYSYIKIECENGLDCPWDEDKAVKTGRVALHAVYNGSNSDGTYSVQQDERFIERDVSSGYYTFTGEDIATSTWVTTMNVEKLNDLTASMASYTDTEILQNGNLNAIVSISANVSNALFKSEGIAEVTPISGSYDTSTPEGVALNSVTDTLSKLMASAYTSSVNTDSVVSCESGRLRGYELVALLDIIRNKRTWGIQSYVKEGTQQEVETSLDMAFDITITMYKGASAIKYELSSENPSVTKIYPVQESVITFGSNEYSVTAEPSCKTVQLDGDTYDLAKNGEQSTVQTLLKPDLAAFSKVIKSVESCPTAKGDIEVRITRADRIAPDVYTEPFSREDKLVFLNAGTFGLTKDQSADSDGSYWRCELSGSALQGALQEWAAPGATFDIQDNFNEEVGKYVLSTSNPIIEFKYIVEISMEIQLDKSSLLVVWNPNPGEDTVSWIGNTDLYYNSSIDANFSEIKEGTILNETYEAMSGVPVTANLYFASGGHEFIVSTSYQIQQIDPYRSYNYSALTSVCDESWAQTQKADLACVTIGSEDCTGHGEYYWSVTTSYQAGTCLPSACPYPDGVEPAECDCVDKDNCPGNHTKAHTHKSSCYVHTGAVSCVLGDYKVEDCTDGGWTKKKYTTKTVTCPTCGGTWSKEVEEEEVCEGGDSGSYSYVKVTDDSDLESWEVLEWSWAHCKCHCPKSLHQQCQAHTSHYFETWSTTMEDVYYMTITKCYVWQLSANMLEVNDSELLGETTTLYSDWQEGSTPGYLYLWVCDKANLTNTNPNCLGRCIYFWNPTAFTVVVDSDGNVVNTTDAVSLNAVITDDRYAGAESSPIEKDLATCDDCDCSCTGGRTGCTYTYLHDNYLKYIKSETESSSADARAELGGRFGMVVVSDFLILCNNDEIDQAVYYHDYSIYDGSDATYANNAGTGLYQRAGFGTSYTQGNKISGAAMHTNAKSNYKYRHSVGENGSGQVINDGIYTLNPAGFLWGQNPTCNAYEENKFSPSDLATAGYTGSMSKTTKYEDLTPMSNILFDNRLAVNQYWDVYYKQPRLSLSNGYDLSEFDTGMYLCTNPSSSPPKSHDSPFYLGTYDIDISTNATNRIYEFGDAKNFYVEVCAYDPNGYGGHFSSEEVDWVDECMSASTIPAPQSDYGLEVLTRYYEGDTTPDRYTNEVVVYVPTAADIGIGIEEGTQDFEEYRNTVPSSANRLTAINIESDGVIVFPTVSVIQETSYSSSLRHVSSNIGNGYGGTGTPLNVCFDPHNGEPWIKEKYIYIDNLVIVDTDGDMVFSDDEIFFPGERIDLEPYTMGGTPLERYPFYVLEAASESIATDVIYLTEAVNTPGSEDYNNWSPNNVDEYKYNLARYHGAINREEFQVVGRIGNLTMVDTGDFRYSNFFKASTNEWLVPNVVYEVDPSSQERVVIDEYDIFGRKGGGSDAWNVYGSQDHKETLPADSSGSTYHINSASGKRQGFYALPLLPTYNNIEAFRDTPMRVGYAAYLDIETIGEYYSGTSYVTVNYSYYGMDKDNNLTPLDVYMLVDDKYVLINDFYNKKDVYEYPILMDWENEKERRMYTDVEDMRTLEVQHHMDGTKSINTYEGYMEAMTPYGPSGNTIYQGNYNNMTLAFDSRTFIGYNFYGDVMEGFPDNNNTNIDGSVDAYKWYRNSQKWYFSNQLPSSAVFVKSGDACTRENIDATTAEFDKAVAVARIVAHGDVWDLKHNGSNSWAQLQEEYPPKDPTPPPYPPTNPDDPLNPDDPDDDPPDDPTPPTVITIIPIPETSRDDVNTEGTH